MPKKKKTKVKLKKKKLKKVKKKEIFKKKATKETKKNQSSSTPSQNDVLEIKKIKKQETQKRIYKVKDFVVYPKHGIGQIVSIEKDTIAGIEISFYRIEITKDKLNLTIPTNQQGNLRALSSINQINKAISILKGKAKVKRTMWSRRAQEYEQKINSGEIYQIAEVVRDLNKNTDMPVDQSYSERQLFEKAYDRLLGEVIAVINIDEETGRVKLNKALGKKPEEINNPTPV
ncbi:MAG: transcriptional regulator [Candidatus Pelagibacter sp.]|nr:transcriptional regulator [Candidatus Pelagibacter sp.]MAW02108.1 transcriptional regulator [Candidatus Pelagibacter sp.]|tara:strand:- start:159 stop:851 length:693 start_codon:yes stop_codon:yes gene_type:complete